MFETVALNRELTREREREKDRVCTLYVSLYTVSSDYYMNMVLDVLFISAAEFLGKNLLKAPKESQNTF